MNNPSSVLRGKYSHQHQVISLQYLILPQKFPSLTQIFALLKLFDSCAMCFGMILVLGVRRQVGLCKSDKDRKRQKHRRKGELGLFTLALTGSCFFQTKSPSEKYAWDEITFAVPPKLTLSRPLSHVQNTLRLFTGSAPVGCY